MSNYSDKAKKIWDDHLGTINVAINIVFFKARVQLYRYKKKL